MPLPSSTVTVESLRAEISDYVSERFDGFVPNPQNSNHHADGKVIRDPIHGFHHLKAWEVEVVDSPLLQRLRSIHQNGLVFLVYPSANHSRFEHSLGVAKVIQDVVGELNTPGLFSETTVGELRLAALLHDSGHGIFSHLSETLIYERWYDNFQPIRQIAPFQGKTVGEIVSYLLVTSPRFRAFLEDINSRYNQNFNVDRIAGLIVGNVQNPTMEAYQRDLITGPLDADKLDYIARDSCFTGIRAEVDVPQIIRSMKVWDRSGSRFPRSLVVKVQGVSFIEQMHFARLLLYPAMYHHQKVRAIECMVRGIFDTIWAAPDEIREPVLKFSRITDFLRLTEGEFLALASREPLIRQQIEKLQNRTLFRRALQVSASLIRGEVESTRYSDLVGLGKFTPEASARLNEIRKTIYDLIPAAAKTDRTLNDIWVDVPDQPSAKDMELCKVDTGESEPVPLDTLFPLASWLKGYAENKWTAHVYGYPDEAFLTSLNRATTEYFNSEYSLTFQDRATTECKLTLR
ncbi:MAG: HD domain-containing protein [Dehalococcoidia bacterium]|nr:HD domain-containing protein [Dehalococcoidia bacterium]